MATIWPGCTLAPKPTTSSAKRSISSSVTARLWTRADVDERVGARASQHALDDPRREGAAARLEAPARVDSHAVRGHGGPGTAAQVPAHATAPGPRDRRVFGLLREARAAHVRVADRQAVGAPG